MQQLRHLSGQCTSDGIRPSPVSMVFESDSIVDAELCGEVLEALQPLEEVPERAKDRQNWPGCDDKVRSTC